MAAKGLAQTDGPEVHAGSQTEVHCKTASFVPKHTERVRFVKNQRAIITFTDLHIAGKIWDHAVRAVKGIDADQPRSMDLNALFQVIWIVVFVDNPPPTREANTVVH